MAFQLPPSSPPSPSITATNWNCPNLANSSVQGNLFVVRYFISCASYVVHGEVARVYVAPAPLIEDVELLGAAGCFIRRCASNVRIERPVGLLGACCSSSHADSKNGCKAVSDVQEVPTMSVWGTLMRRESASCVRRRLPLDRLLRFPFDETADGPTGAF